MSKKELFNTFRGEEYPSHYDFFEWAEFGDIIPFALIGIARAYLPKDKDQDLYWDKDGNVINASKDLITFDRVMGKD